MIITGLPKVLEYFGLRKEPYFVYRNSKGKTLIEDHYKKFCTVLKTVIIEAKKLHFINQIILFYFNTCSGQLFYFVEWPTDAQLIDKLLYCLPTNALTYCVT